LTGTVAVPPFTVAPPLCAPPSENWICLTPEPPALSTAVSVAVTSALLQPLPLAAGARDALVLGGVVSANAVCPGPSVTGVPPITTVGNAAVAWMADVAPSTTTPSPAASDAVASVPSSAVNVRSAPPASTSSDGVEQWSCAVVVPSKETSRLWRVARPVQAHHELQWRGLIAVVMRIVSACTLGLHSGRGEAL